MVEEHWESVPDAHAVVEGVKVADEVEHCVTLPLPGPLRETDWLGVREGQCVLLKALLAEASTLAE